MKRFSMPFFALICAISFSACKTENELAQPVINYPKFQNPKLPDGIVRVTGHHSDSLTVVETHGPGLAERKLNELIAGGATLIESTSNTWKVELSPVQQAILPRGRDGICLEGTDYFTIENGICSSANGWQLEAVFTQGQQSNAVFIYLENPWIKWAECSQNSCGIVQGGLDDFEEMISDALIYIGVPQGFSVCLAPTAIDQTDGDHFYTISVYVNNVPTGLSIGFANVWVYNCLGAGAATPQVNLIQNFGCTQPPACLSSGPN